MAFMQVYIVLLMAMTAASQQPDTNFTDKPLEPILSEPKKELWNSTSSLGDRRAVCFRAAADVTAAAVNDSVPLHPLTSSQSSITCDSRLLVHYTLTQFWTYQSSDVMCQHRDEYGEVTGCVLEATKTCWPAEDPEYFPDEDRVKAGLCYLCDVAAADQFDVDMTCARSLSQQVLDCISQDVETMEAGDGALSSDGARADLICRTYDIADLCYWETLEVCGEETAAAYTRMVSLYFRPPSCTSGSSASKYNVDYAFALVVFSFIGRNMNFVLIR